MDAACFLTGAQFLIHAACRSSEFQDWAVGEQGSVCLGPKTSREKKEEEKVKRQGWDGMGWPHTPLTHYNSSPTGYSAAQCSAVGAVSK